MACPRWHAPDASISNALTCRCRCGTPDHATLGAKLRPCRNGGENARPAERLCLGPSGGRSIVSARGVTLCATLWSTWRERCHAHTNGTAEEWGGERPPMKGDAEQHPEDQKQQAREPDEPASVLLGHDKRLRLQNRNWRTASRRPGQFLMHRPDLPLSGRSPTISVRRLRSPHFAAVGCAELRVFGWGCRAGVPSWF